MLTMSIEKPFCKKLKISGKVWRWMIFYDFNKGLNSNKMLRIVRSTFGNEATSKNILHSLELLRVGRSSVMNFM